MKYRMGEERWDAVKAYLGKVWKNPNNYPDEGILLSLSDTEMTQLFTKKRLELIRLIQKKKPKSVTELSDLSERMLSAVMRDLELLEALHIVTLEKKGKTVFPKVEKELLILPLIDLKAKGLSDMKVALVQSASG